MSAFNRLKRGLDDAYKHRKKIKGAAQSIGHYINEVKRTAAQQQKVRDMDSMTMGGTPVYRRLSISSTGSRTPTSSLGHLRQDAKVDYQFFPLLYAYSS